MSVQTITSKQEAIRDHTNGYKNKRIISIFLGLRKNGKERISRGAKYVDVLWGKSCKNSQKSLKIVTVRGLTEGRKTRQVDSAHKIQLGSFLFVGLKILISGSIRLQR